jgi:hypothetical protein
MNSLTITAEGAAPEPASITELQQWFGERWTITYGADLAVWSAERRSASGLRLICDRDPAGLAAKLAVAEAGQ